MLMDLTDELEQSDSGMESLTASKDDTPERRPDEFFITPSLGSSPSAGTPTSGPPTGGPLGGPLGGPIGGNTGGSPGGHTGGYTGGQAGGHTGGQAGGHTGGHTGGTTGGSTGGHTGGSTVGTIGGPTGGNFGGPTGGPLAGPLKEYDDEPDETLSERLWGLTEMFPECVRSCTYTFTTNTLSGVKTLYGLSRSVMWVIASSSVILFAPVIFEVERAQMAELEKSQQKQVLLGTNTSLSGPMPNMPPMPR